MTMQARSIIRFPPRSGGHRFAIPVLTAIGARYALARYGLKA